MEIIMNVNHSVKTLGTAAATLTIASVALPASALLDLARLPKLVMKCAVEIKSANNAEVKTNLPVVIKEHQFATIFALKQLSKAVRGKKTFLSNLANPSERKMATNPSSTPSASSASSTSPTPQAPPTRAAPPTQAAPPNRPAPPVPSAAPASASLPAVANFTFKENKPAEYENIAKHIMYGDEQALQQKGVTATMTKEVKNAQKNILQMSAENKSNHQISTEMAIPLALVDYLNPVECDNKLSQTLLKFVVQNAQGASRGQKPEKKALAHLAKVIDSSHIKSVVEAREKIFYKTDISHADLSKEFNIPLPLVKAIMDHSKDHFTIKTKYEFLSIEEFQELTSAPFSQNVETIAKWVNADPETLQEIKDMKDKVCNSDKSDRELSEEMKLPESLINSLRTQVGVNFTPMSRTRKQEVVELLAEPLVKNSVDASFLQELISNGKCSADEMREVIEMHKKISAPNGQEGKDLATDEDIAKEMDISEEMVIALRGRESSVKKAPADPLVKLDNGTQMLSSTLKQIENSLDNYNGAALRKLIAENKCTREDINKIKKSKNMADPQPISEGRIRYVFQMPIAIMKNPAALKDAVTNTHANSRYTDSEVRKLLELQDYILDNSTKSNATLAADLDIPPWAVENLKRGI